jgi:hypothetical protein
MQFCIDKADDKTSFIYMSKELLFIMSLEKNATLMALPSASNTVTNF